MGVKTFGFAIIHHLAWPLKNVLILECEHMHFVPCGSFVVVVLKVLPWFNDYLCSPVIKSRTFSCSTSAYRSPFKCVLRKRDSLYAHNGSKTTINGDVIILRSLTTTSLICLLTHWLMNRPESDLCDALYELTQLQLDILSSLWTFSNYIWNCMRWILHEMSSVIFPEPSMDLGHQINFWIQDVKHYPLLLMNMSITFCWTFQNSTDRNAQLMVRCESSRFYRCV